MVSKGSLLLLGYHTACLTQAEFILGLCNLMNVPLEKFLFCFDTFQHITVKRVVSTAQTRWLSWFLTQTRPSTNACSSTVSFWTACPWTLIHTAASSTRSSPLTLWSQSTPPQKYVVSEASSLLCAGVSVHSSSNLSARTETTLWMQSHWSSLQHFPHHQQTNPCFYAHNVISILCNLTLLQTKNE